MEFVLYEVPKANATGLASYPLIVHACDYDDAAVPSSLNEVFEYGKNTRVDKFSPTRNVLRRTLVPRVSNTVYRTGATSAYSLASPSTLVDCTNTDTPHYGLKWWTSGLNSTDYTGGFINIYVKYHLRLVATR